MKAPAEIALRTRASRLRKDRARALETIELLAVADLVDEQHATALLTIHRAAAQATIELGDDSSELRAETQRVDELMPSLLAAALTRLPPPAAIAAVENRPFERRALIAKLLLLGIPIPRLLSEELAEALLAYNTGEALALLEAPRRDRGRPPPPFSQLRRMAAAVESIEMLRMLGDNEVAAANCVAEEFGEELSTLRDWRRAIYRRRTQSGVRWGAGLKLKLLGLRGGNLREHVNRSITIDAKRHPRRKRGRRAVMLEKSIFVQHD